MSETRVKGHAEGLSAAPAGGSESGRPTAVQTATDAAAWWQQHDQRVYQCIKLWVEQWWDPQQCSLLEAVARCSENIVLRSVRRSQISKSALSDSRRLATLRSASLSLLIRSSAGPRFRRAS